VFKFGSKNFGKRRRRRRRRRDFVIVREDFKKALHHYTRKFQGSVFKISRNQSEGSPFENYKSEEEALRNARQLKQWNSEN